MIPVWRLLSPLVDAVLPHTFEEVQNTNLWWTTQFVGYNFSFTEQRAYQLAQARLSRLRDLWEPNTTILRLWPVLQQAFSLVDAEQRHVDLFQQRVPLE